MTDPPLPSAGAPAVVEHGDLGAITQTELGEHRADVIAERAFGHAERISRFGVIQTFRDRTDDFAFTLGQGGERRFVGTGAPAMNAARSKTSPSSTFWPAITARSAGAMDATSCLIR